MTEVTHSNNGGRIPPQDIVAEKSILGAILISDNAIADALEVLRPEDFYDEKNRLVFGAMLNLYDQHRPIDLLTLTAELKSLKELKGQRTHGQHLFQGQNLILRHIFMLKQIRLEDCLASISW